MKAVYTVYVKRHSLGAADAHGNRADVYAANEALSVYGIAPRTSSEPDQTRTVVVVGLMLLAPPDALVGPLDRVVVNGVTYDVDGELADYTQGPFGYEPGVVVNLKKTEG